MGFPAEIQLLIFQQVVDTLPWEDIWKARLVCTSFNHEITTLMMKSPRLELEGLCFKPGSITPREQLTEQSMWNYFPDRLKRLYLYQKIQLHSRSPCVWSTLVQGILDLPNERTNTEETYTLINKLVDAWLCGDFFSMRPFVDSTLTQKEIEAICNPGGDNIECESLRETLNLALVTSAIHRDDCSELRTLLSQGVNLAQESVRFRILPLAEATYYGSKEIAEILVANNCPMIFGGLMQFHPMTNALYVHIERGNKEVLKIWIDHLKNTAQNLAEYLSPFIVVGLGSTEMVDFIDDEYGDELDRSQLHGEIFRAAIRSKDVDRMKHVLDRGGVDINRVEGRDDITPLHLAVDILEPDESLHDLDKINRETEISARAVEFLLKNGADLNGRGPAMQRTPFAYAVSVGNVEAAIVLFDYGATVDKDEIIPFLTYDPHDWTHLLRRLGIE